MNTPYLKTLFDLERNQKAELQLTEAKIYAERKRLTDKIEVKTRKRCVIYTRPDGLSIHIPKTLNNHRERTISYYNKVKGEVAISNSRYSLYELKLWLVQK